MPGWILNMPDVVCQISPRVGPFLGSGFTWNNVTVILRNDYLRRVIVLPMYSYSNLKNKEGSP